MRIFKLFMLPLIGILVFSFTGVAAQKTIKIAFMGSQTDEDMHGSLVFKDYVEATSNGEMKVEIYHSAQLCSKFVECIQGVQANTFQVTISTIGGFGLIYPPAQVLDLPYILRDDRVAECFFDGPFLSDLREAVMEKFPKMRLMMVGNTGGWRNFMTTKSQIKEPSDVKGQKIRTIPADIQKEMVKMLGGNPTPISWPEVYTALATGVVEGTKNGITDIVSMKFHEHLRYATLDGHAYMAAFWWLNNDFWNSLSHAEKVIVNDGFYHMMWETRQSPKSGAIAAYEEFKKAGGTIYKPTPEQKQMFVDSTKGMYKWYEDQYGREWLDKFIAETKLCEAKIDAASSKL